MCLICRYKNDPIKALQHFNQARKDGEWGEQALFNMVKICINPDDDCLGELHMYVCASVYRVI